ncbi:MAG TPA: 50S rRNA methyltransferase, partial [Phycisphaerales bacterium]|nr:50S rRNA methyltransferase [Phycisphaerales bacterium]
RVLDLGCAPGAWLQVAAEIVGPRGVVVGVDLQPVLHSFPDHVHHLVADIYEADPLALRGPSGRLFDVVLSDMAPNTIGHGDDLLSARLCARVLEVLPDLLAPGGNFTMKVLEGGEQPRLLRDTRALFATVKAYKPPASRDVSREIYIVGHGFAPTPAQVRSAPLDS